MRSTIRRRTACTGTVLPPAGEGRKALPAGPVELHPYATPNDAALAARNRLRSMRKIITGRVSAAGPERVCGPRGLYGRQAEATACWLRNETRTRPRDFGCRPVLTHSISC